MVISPFTSLLLYYSSLLFTTLYYSLLLFTYPKRITINPKITCLVEGPPIATDFTDENIMKRKLKKKNISPGVWSRIVEKKIE